MKLFNVFLVVCVTLSLFVTVSAHMAVMQREEKIERLERKVEMLKEQRDDQYWQRQCSEKMLEAERNRYAIPTWYVNSNLGAVK
jgi:cell division protein FtsL